MPAYVSDTLSAVSDLEGTYAVRVPPPPPITAPGTDWMGLVGQFAWGPVDQVVVVGSTGEYLDKFAPAGQGYTYPGHVALARTQPALLKIVRVKPTGAAVASMTLIGTANGDGATNPQNALNVAAKYYGALPITIGIAAAQDGVAAHFDLSVAVGTEVETYHNLSTISGAGGVVLGDQTTSKYLAALAVGNGTLAGTTRPRNGTYTLGVAATNVAVSPAPVAGADGAAAAGDYVGTAGTANRGMACFEGDQDVKPMCVDDCGASLRVAVNTALVAHAVANFPHRAVINPDSTLASVADAIADLGSNAVAYRDEHAIYVPNWAYVLNEAGAEVLTPPAPFVAAALTHMPRHLGANWKDPRNTQYYAKIKRLAWTANRASLILARAAGVAVLVRTDAGGIAPKSDVTTSLVAGRTSVARSRMEDFIIQGITAGQEVYEGGPIDAATRAEQRARVAGLLQPMKDAAGNGLAAQTEAIVDFQVWDAASQADLDAGVNKIGLRVKTLAPQFALAFLVTVGPTVTVAPLSATA